MTQQGRPVLGVWWDIWPFATLGPTGRRARNDHFNALIASASYSQSGHLPW